MIIDSMTRAEAARRRADGFREQPCVVLISNVTGSWHLGPGYETCDRYEDATCLTVAQAISDRDKIPDDAIIQILDEPKKPLDGRTYLNFAEVAQLDRGHAINDSQCKVRLPGYNRWLSRDGVDFSASYERALSRTTRGHWESSNSTWLFCPDCLQDPFTIEAVPEARPISLTEVLSASESVAKPRDKKTGKLCRIEQVIPPTVIVMLKQSPKNAEVRAMVRRSIFKKIPDDKETFEHIRDWIEANIMWSGQNPKGEVVSAVTVDEMVGFQIPVDIKDTESGSRYYTMPRTGRYVHQFNANYLIRIMQNHTTVDRLLDFLITDSCGEAEEIREENGTDSFAMQDGPINYGDFDGESVDHDDFVAHVNVNIRAEIRQQLVSFLRAHASADDLRRLRIE